MSFMNISKLLKVTALLICLFLTPFLRAQVGGVSGTNSFSIAGENGDTIYKIVSASTLGDSVFTGVVASNDGDKNVTFATETDENNNTTYPFFAAGSFDPAVQVPEANGSRYTINLSSKVITSISNPTYGPSGFDTSGTGFANAPQVIISPSDEGGTTAEATASIDGNGKVTGYTVTEGGSGYTTSPDVTVVGGPHFLRVVDENSSYYGRCFLISGNSQTTLTVDFSNLSNSESGYDVSNFFPAGTQVEVVPAATLSRVFDEFWAPSGWTSASSYRSMGSEDWVYVWDPSLGGYVKYSHLTASGTYGWYSRDKGYGIACNNTVIYPDEGFIIAKRNVGTLNLSSSIVGDESPAKLYLPESGDLFIANNPFGMKLLLTEIIPSTEIGTETTKFRPGSDDSGDTITVISGNNWKKYWYKTGVNAGITSIMKAGAKAGTGGSNAMIASDLMIGSGDITAVQSCTNAAGDNPTTNGNDTNYTKLTISNTAPAVGFTISLSDIQGRMLSDDGGNEVNASTGENVESNGTGSIVYSSITGNFEVVGSGSGYVVVEKQRDVNFVSGEGSPAWSIGTLGSGYSQNAKWYAIGGNGTGAEGTVTSGGNFTVTSGGSGYTAAPQIIVSGGGWRYTPAGDIHQDFLDVNASDGLIIRRGSTGGVKAFIEAPNPTQ